MKRTALLPLAALLLLAAKDNTLTERQRALHALNRLGFGQRPGEVEQVMQEGVDVWIDRQLHPERIADRAVDARVAGMTTMQLSNAEILKRYYLPTLELRKEAKNDGVDKKELRREYMENIPPEQRPQRVMEDLQSQRILRAAESERQLNEVMVDFWMNHFNVYSGKGIDRFLLTSYERDTIRPQMWGKFEDLLMATAKSPAMLFYLDNARSVAAPENRPQRPPRMVERRGWFGRRYMEMVPSRQPKDGAREGLNENYARELMELHTLGVDGGYTQKDVTELARVLTGWTMTSRRDGVEGAQFIFRANLHDVGAKSVLGVRIAPGGGMDEGERMIHILAHQPATAHHIALKLCQRFVADEPPPALVDRVAKRFLATDGDLRETVKAVISSPEFWDPAVYRAKVKSPFEYVISAVRAVDAHVDNPLPIARALQQIGEPLYGAQPPTGYSDKADVWINTGALINRLNFALSLAGGKLPGVHLDAAPPAMASVKDVAQALVGGELSSETKATIAAKTGDEAQPATIVGLILGSPEFQRQ